jgi:uncharacterized protein YcbK (DUF882 family)
MKDYEITIKDYLMGRNKVYASEFNSSITDNAKFLLIMVNHLLTDLRVLPVTVTSGWRPASLNRTIPTAAKKSLHTIGRAVDISDPDGHIAKLILGRPELLRKYGLWMEDKSFTPTWVHLDIGDRSPRELRVFKP